MSRFFKSFWSFISGAVIGILGGLMGLGGAEFRLPVLVGAFKFSTIQGVVINLVVSLVTVAFSFIFRSSSIPFSDVTTNWFVIVNLVAGTLLGAMAGVSLATKINAKKLDSIVFIFLLLLGIFMITHSVIHFNPFELSFYVKIISVFTAGLVIGIFSSMLGVAGGELIIPTIILLYAIDIKLAGTLSLCVSFPTVIVGILKYRQKKELKVVKENRSFVAFMATGSILGAFLGSRMLIGISTATLQIILGTILLLSAIKTFTHKSTK
jgi:uncharacterized membrane protein YfcA